MEDKTNDAMNMMDKLEYKHHQEFYFSCKIFDFWPRLVYLASFSFNWSLTFSSTNIRISAAVLVVTIWELFDFFFSYSVITYFYFSYFRSLRFCYSISCFRRSFSLYSSIYLCSWAFSLSWSLWVMFLCSLMLTHYLWWTFRLAVLIKSYD